MIDEWQEVPEILEPVKDRIDADVTAKGQFILTGSAKPKKGSEVNNATGRIGEVKMKTMTLFESGDSTGQVSLAELAHGGSVAANVPNQGILGLAHLIVRGGWPTNVDVDQDLAHIVPAAYVRSIKETFAGRMRISDALMGVLMASLARRECTPSSVADIVRDIRAQAKEPQGSHRLR